MQADNGGERPRIPPEMWSATKLTHNHNPSCPLERRRIEATVHEGVKGFVTAPSGVHRVQDMLSVSRAIGNRILSPFLSDIPDLYEVRESDLEHTV